MITGIYQIKCTKNNKVYVGQANDIGDRWKDHIHQLCNGKHSCKPLQEDWDNYGFENFQFSIVEQAEGNTEDTKKELDILEAKNGAKLKATDSSTGYNYISRFRYETHNEGYIALDNKIRIRICEELGYEALALYCCLLAYYDIGKDCVLTRTGFLSNETGLKTSNIKKLLEELENHDIIEEQFPDYARAGLRVFRIISEEEYEKKVEENNKLREEIEQLKNKLKV